MRASPVRRVFAILASAVLLVTFTAGPATAGNEWPVTPGGGPESWCEFLCYYNVNAPQHPAFAAIARAYEAKYPGSACYCGIIVIPK